MESNENNNGYQSTMENQTVSGFMHKKITKENN